MTTRLPYALSLLATLACAGCSRNQEPVFTGYAEADLVYVASSGPGILERLDVVRGSRVDATRRCSHSIPSPNASSAAPPRRACNAPSHRCKT